MAGSMIQDLDANTAPIGTDILPLMDIGTTDSQKITIESHSSGVN